MLTYGPVWRTEFIIIYFVASFATLVLCSVICVAIARTKKTPYPTRLLCIGLLCYDCLFLSCASIAKLFPHEESFLLRHLSRGCQTAAQLIVAFMAFERFFVLNWPYIYLKTSNSLIRKVCLYIIAFSFLQFVLIKGLGCYARGRYLNCIGSIYFPFICLVVLISSFAVFTQIYTIIRRKALAMTQYKGTIAAFMYLVNCSCFIGLYLGLALYNTLLRTQNATNTGWLTQIADVVCVLNCTIDPLIYGLWFKEVRLEILKIVAVCFRSVRPYVDKMRVDVFSIVYDLKEANIIEQQSKE